LSLLMLLSDVSPNTTAINRSDPTLHNSFLPTVICLDTIFVPISTYHPTRTIFEAYTLPLLSLSAEACLSFSVRVDVISVGVFPWCRDRIRMDLHPYESQRPRCRRRSNESAHFSDGIVSGGGLPRVKPAIGHGRRG